MIRVPCGVEEDVEDRPLHATPWGGCPPEGRGGDVAPGVAEAVAGVLLGNVILFGTA